MDSSPIGQTGMDRESAFVPGLLLNERFYAELVRPILADAFPRLHYSAALIGSGSDVLGYDTPRSTDHEWGPRLLIFVAAADRASHAEAIRSVLGERLPPTFLGYSTHFGPPGPDGVRSMAPHEGGAVAHKVEVHTPAILASWLGVDPRHEMSAADWLVMPQQRLLGVTAGRVYHDGLRLLNEVRETLAFFPRDVWLYLLGAQWKRLSQQEAFVGRTGEVGDELGSAVVAAALVRDLIGLAFLLEQRYAPYSKWLGTAFSHLTCAPRLSPSLRQALQAESWQAREDALAAAYEIVATLHNALGVTAPLDPRPRPFYGRPFRVLFAERFCEASLAAIADADVRAIIERAGVIGSIDQVSDNTDVRTASGLSATLRTVYEPSPWLD